MIQHILFPTDGSEASFQALNYLRSMAKQYQATVNVLHTYDFAMEHVLSRYGTETSVIHTFEEHLSEAGENLLGELKQTLENDGISVKNTFNLKGDAGQQIIQISEQEGCDLILMGTRGLGTIKSMLLGSTSHFVVNHSHKIPVFLIPVK